MELTRRLALCPPNPGFVGERIVDADPLDEEPLPLPLERAPFALSRASCEESSA